MASDYPPTYPPDMSCWKPDSPDEFWDPAVWSDRNCSVTENMVKFLNLTATNYKPYLNAYCLNPPTDDECPFGFCPNPDIAGPLVRVANYITGFCLAILIFYSPEDVVEAFWSQTLITYSLLVTCWISLFQGQLTRFHSVILVSIVCSPVNVYFTGYSIRAFWSKHRLNSVLGKTHFIRRGLVFVSVGFWIAILIDAYLPRSWTKFSQDSCRGSSIAEAFFLGTPFLFAWAIAIQGKAGILLLFIFLAIPILIVISWIIAIFLRRNEIWPPNRPRRPRFGKVWRTVVENYPFLRFWSVVAIPTVYWIGIIELGILTENDDTFSLTFGQVLAVFATLPPIIQVLALAPDFWGWLKNLSWVRMMRRRPQWGPSMAPGVPGPEPIGSPGAEFIDDKKEMDDGIP